MEINERQPKRIIRDTQLHAKRQYKWYYYSDLQYHSIYQYGVYIVLALISM